MIRQQTLMYRKQMEKARREMETDDLTSIGQVSPERMRDEQTFQTQMGKISEVY